MAQSAERIAQKTVKQCCSAAAKAKKEKPKAKKGLR